MSKKAPVSPPLLALVLVALPGGSAGAAPGPGDFFAPGFDPSANPPESALTDPVRPSPLGDKVVFVNFEGADMNGGCGNDPQNNCSTIYTGRVGAFAGDNAARAAIVQVMREKTAAYGISVTSARPASGDYDMEMVGPWLDADPGSAAGVAPGIDCWDNAGGQVSFTMAGGNSDAVSEIILQEIAHTWGLAHVDDMQDLLFPTTQGNGKVFKDTCLQIVADVDLNPSSSGCSHHQQACGSNSQQNSHQELLLIFGPGTADTVAPTVTITAPADGATFPSGTKVDVGVDLEDNQIPMLIQTTLQVESPALPMTLETVADYAAPTSLTYPLTGLPDGTYTVTVSGLDEEGNPASDAVTFTVGNGGGGTTTGGSTGGTATGGSTGGSGGPGTTSAGSGGSGGSGGGEGSGGGSASAGSATATAGSASGGSEEGGDGGCGCTATPSTPALATIWLLGAVLRRRRR